MDLEFPNEEIKKNILEKMKENHSLERIEDEYRFGITIAMNEIENDESINYHPFKDSDKNELLGLQFVYQYLKQKGFQFTLSCFLDESNFAFNESFQPMDIKKFIEDFINPLKQNQLNYKVEPPKIITKSVFNNFSYIVEIDAL